MFRITQNQSFLATFWLLFTSQAVLRSLLSGEQIVPVFPINVRRENIVHDTVRILSQGVQNSANAESGAFRLPLRVKFEGEEGLDEGGVKREFFQVIISENGKIDTSRKCQIQK